MSTLQQEKDLLFDRDLHRKMAATGPLATAAAWLGAASALSLRSLPHLTAELTGRGLNQFPREDGLWMEYIKAVSLYPEKLHKAWEDLSTAKKPPKDVEVLLALAEYYLERDAEGLKRLEGIAENKRNALYHEVLGHYAMARHDYRSAVKAYRQAHRLAPKDLRLMYHLGEGYDALGDVSKALQWLYRAVGRERHFVQAWNALCRIHLKLRQLDRARQAMGMAFAVNPRDWGVYFTFADDYLERGLFGRARAILKDILDLQPRDVIAAEVHNYLGYLFFLKGHHAEAMPCFHRAIELNPALAVAWLNLGNLHFHLKKMDDARRCYQEALRVDRNMASASCQLGLIEMDQGRLDKARDPLERALALDPTEYWAHLGLSEYHRRTKNYVGALSEAQQALRIAPDSADVYNYLGIALECNRRYFDAEKSYRRALELDPLNRWAANNLGYLYEKIMRVAPEYKGSAIEAWKRRLLICRDTGASMRGAVNHLEKLGVRPSTLRKWIEQEPGPKAR
jgi:tetratricopeptide (TPR) repeat protein